MNKTFVVIHPYETYFPQTLLPVGAVGTLVDGVYVFGGVWVHRWMVENLKHCFVEVADA